MHAVSAFDDACFSLFRLAHADRRRQRVHGRRHQSHELRRAAARDRCVLQAPHDAARFRPKPRPFLVARSNRADFLDLRFEVASAFGTVGVSRGVTPQLDHFGRPVIGVIMFVGRVGPLTLGFLLATSIPPRVPYPARRTDLG